MKKHDKRVFRRWPACLILVTVLAVTARARPVNGTVVDWQPAKLNNGSPVLFQIVAPRNVQSLSAIWLGHEINFFRLASGSSWYGIAGVSVETSPGMYDLRLTETFANGRTAQILKKIRLARAVYPKITVRVAKQYTEPSPQQLTEVAANKDLKQKVFSVASTQRLWSGPFVPPAVAPISDVFGTERVFNQEVQSRHQGLDYAVPSGTPVHAVNSGVVVLARPMFFEGNCIVIDHGQGLLSLYLHLSEFKVKEGEKVDSGQLIALSGGTGRASGAHLHLAIRWQGIYLNPAILLKIQIPPAD
jgi:murein DD-endopeptidase MepM/ murein hydrolase activator NlpD